MTAEIPEGKKGPRITEIVAIVTLMVSILVAVTSLLSNSGNLPSWWYQFSFVFLIILMFSVPIILFQGPIRDWVADVMLTRGRDSVSRKHASEFRDLVVGADNFTNLISALLGNIRRHYANEIKSSLAMHALESYNEQEARNELYKIRADIEESDVNFRELCLHMDKFEMVLNTFKRSLKILEVFAHEVMTSGEKPIAKGIEAEYEAFREKYNDFLKDLTAFCHKMNQETEAYDFPEHHFEYLKKW
jgi:hypothetical protein